MCETIHISFQLYMKQNITLTFYSPVGRKLRESFQNLVVRSVNDLLSGNDVSPNLELFTLQQIWH
jgi:hypothetical protein